MISTDSIKKSLAVIGFAAFGAVASNSQVIDILQQPVDVSKCVGDTTAYLDIIAQYPAANQNDVRYIWYRVNEDGNDYPIMLNSEGEIVISNGMGTTESRLRVPSLNEKYAGTYFGAAFLDIDPLGTPNFPDAGEPIVFTDMANMNVVTEPIILSENYMVYQNIDMMDIPVREGKNAGSIGIEDGNIVVIDIDAHIFGQYDTENGNIPDYEIDIQWYTEDQNNNPVMLMDNNTFAGVNSDMLSINATNALLGEVYWAEMTGQCGTVTSTRFTLNEAPVLTVDMINDIEVCAGEETMVTVNASVTGTGETLSYQWMMGGMELMDGPEFSGTTTNELTILSGYITQDISDLSVEVTSMPSNLVMMSDPFMITLTPDPVYTTNLDTPVLNLTAGDPLDLAVAVDGATSYQWYKDGAPIAGETMDAFSIAATDAMSSGVYKVHAINDCGVEVPSNDVTVTVTAGTVSDVRGVVPGTITVSPNPASDIVTARLNLESFAKNATFSLHNTTGKVVASQSFENNGSELVATFNLNDMNLSNGNYFVVINVDGNTVTRNLVISAR